MNQTNRQARAKKKAKQNRVMRNPLGSGQQDVIAALKKALRRRGIKNVNIRAATPEEATQTKMSLE